MWLGGLQLTCVHTAPAYRVKAAAGACAVVWPKEALKVDMAK